MESTQLFDLLRKRGIAPTSQRPVTLMRHKDGSYPLHKYVGTEQLTLYQSRQKRRHAPGGLIVAFYGHKIGHGLLLGVWRVVGVMSALEAHSQGLLNGTFESFDESSHGYFHQLEATDFLSDLRLTLEVTWGGRPNSWRRVLTAANDYPIGISAEPPVKFDGVSNASLVMAEMRIALNDLRWQQGLGAVAGVYLLTDEFTGRHYVGSASGGCGVWQRWAEYAQNGHGDNDQLVDLLERCPGRENEFRLTLLESMPLDTPRSQVLARETFWKMALGSRTFGLNSN
ncbi:GIY-YIG nuclease family protein [Rugamonas sp. A1-17]|nr:GIY-YIG nuclease family protein [Rugamonas sp. A1-17]